MKKGCCTYIKDGETKGGLEGDHQGDHLDKEENGRLWVKGFNSHTRKRMKITLVQPFLPLWILIFALNVVFICLCLWLNNCILGWIKDHLAFSFLHGELIKIRGFVYCFAWIRGYWKLEWRKEFFLLLFH